MAWVCGLTVASSLQILVGAFDHGVLDNVGWWWWRGAIDLVIVSTTELMTVFPNSLNAFSGGSGLFQYPFVGRGFPKHQAKANAMYVVSGRPDLAWSISSRGMKAQMQDQKKAESRAEKRRRKKKEERKQIKEDAI